MILKKVQLAEHVLLKRDICSFDAQNYDKLKGLSEMLQGLMLDQQDERGDFENLQLVAIYRHDDGIMQKIS